MLRILYTALATSLTEFDPWYKNRFVNKKTELGCGMICFFNVSLGKFELSLRLIWNLIRYHKLEVKVGPDPNS
jgi:hypothetical protein